MLKYIHRCWTRAVSIRYPRAQPQSLLWNRNAHWQPAVFFPSANISLALAPSLGTHPTSDILAAPRFSSRFSSNPTFVYTAGLPLRDSGSDESLLRAYRRALAIVPAVLRSTPSFWIYLPTLTRAPSAPSSPSRPSSTVLRTQYTRHPFLRIYIT